VPRRYDESLDTQSNVEALEKQDGAAQSRGAGSDAGAAGRTAGVVVAVLAALMIVTALIVVTVYIRRRRRQLNAASTGQFVYSDRQTIHDRPIRAILQRKYLLLAILLFIAS